MDNKNDYYLPAGLLAPVETDDFFGRISTAITCVVSSAKKIISDTSILKNIY